MPDCVGSGLSSISALRLIQYAPDMCGNGIQADRQYQGNIFVGPTDGKQTQNLYFTSGKLVRERYGIAAAMQQGIDIGNQARHPDSTREVLGFAQLLAANSSICIRLLCYQKGSMPKQGSSEPGPRAHSAIERYRLIEVSAGAIWPMRRASKHGQVELSGTEGHGGTKSRANFTRQITR